MPLRRRKTLRALGAIAAAAALPAARPGFAQEARSEARPEDWGYGYAPRGQVPAGYPAGYDTLLRAAEDEGELSVYSTTDLDVAQPLIDAFQKLYPRIVVRYEDLGSTELHYRFVAERDLGRPSADVVWSSAMDQQAALVQRGFAEAYASPELAALPAWAQWDQRLFATTYEPVAIAYRRDAWGQKPAPQSRDALTKALMADTERLRGRTTTYNVERSGVGFMLATADAQSIAGYWDLMRAFGATRPSLQLTTGAMLRRLIKGDALVAYNVLGAYALEAQRRDQSIQVVFPEDGTLVASRLALINSRAPHPNAARLWLDFLLSRQGQTVAAMQSHLVVVRSDVEGDYTAARVAARLGPAARPIALGPGLTRYNDSAAWREFVLGWRKVLEPR